jgi:tRNA pseudouridine13 synthase
MKDRRSIGEQWFSVCTSKDETAFPVIDGARLLSATRHARKLRKGQLAGNHFDICLRDLGVGDWERGLHRVVTHGVPNYFGAQRFGGDNLQAALAWLPDRQRTRLSRFKQGLYLSVLRSYLFNEVLGVRVEAGNWNRPVDGEVLSDGAETATPTGPLWGRGRSAASGAAAEIEFAALAAHRDLLVLLEHAGLTQGRRGLVLRPAEARWRSLQGGLKISFWLPSGGYATAMLREVFDLAQPEAASW